VAETERRRQIAANGIRAIARITFVLLALRVGLLLFAPSPADQRVAWFLLGTELIEDPFRLVMPTVFIDPHSGSILDTVALAAMLGYALLEAGLVWALEWRRTPPEPLPPLPASLLAMLAAVPERRRPSLREAAQGAPRIESVTTVRVSGHIHSRRG
jgi:hypothetical protein